MVHETSLCINTDIKKELFIASQQINRSMCCIAKDLIKLVLNNCSDTVIEDKLIEYQERHLYKNLEIFRYRLSENEYVSFISARCRLRYSVSKLLLIGFLLFFKKYLLKFLNKEQLFFINNNYTRIYKDYAICIQNFLNAVKKIE